MERLPPYADQHLGVNGGLQRCLAPCRCPPGQTYRTGTLPAIHLHTTPWTALCAHTASARTALPTGGFWNRHGITTWCRSCMVAGTSFMGGASRAHGWTVTGCLPAYTLRRVGFTRALVPASRLPPPTYHHHHAHDCLIPAGSSCLPLSSLMQVGISMPAPSAHAPRRCRAPTLPRLPRRAPDCGTATHLHYGRVILQPRVGGGREDAACRCGWGDASWALRHTRYHTARSADPAFTANYSAPPHLRPPPRAVVVGAAAMNLLTISWAASRAAPLRNLGDSRALPWEVVHTTQRRTCFCTACPAGSAAHAQAFHAPPASMAG